MGVKEVKQDGKGKGELKMDIVRDRQRDRVWGFEE